MNDLPQRPKFYLHRSRRFWGGLVILLIMCGWALKNDSLDSKIALGQWRPSPGWLNKVDVLEIGQRDGGILVSFVHAKPESGLRGSSVVWDMAAGSWDPYLNHGQLPSCSAINDKWTWSGEVFVPSWLICLLWIIIWIWWMGRGDKLEEKRFLKPPQPHDP